MSGTPTLSQVQEQWDAVLSLQESLRRYADGTALAKLETIEGSAVGEYTPQGLARETATTRAGLSALVRGARDAAYLQSVIFEWGGLIGSPFGSALAVFRDVYEYCHANSITVPSRQVVFGAPGAGPTNRGNGTLRRLTVDWNGYATEACRVEEKRLRCIVDANSGAIRGAEQFTIDGSQPSLDALGLVHSGAGPLGALTARNAGASTGGSLLRNSSFDGWDTSGTSLIGWALDSGSILRSPDFYRRVVGSPTPYSVSMAGGTKITQELEDGARRLSANSPYFLRIMVKAGSATGPLVLTLGGVAKTIPDVSVLGAGWAEVAIDAGVDSWFQNFNVEGLPISIDFQGSGSIVVDDAIFTPWDVADGTFWLMIGGDIPWLVDDTFGLVDTGGDPNITGIRNYHNYLASLGYLPHDNGDGSATWLDPTP